MILGRDQWHHLVARGAGAGDVQATNAKGAHFNQVRSTSILCIRWRKGAKEENNIGARRMLLLWRVLASACRSFKFPVYPILEYLQSQRQAPDSYL